MGAVSLPFILKLIKSQIQPVEDPVAGDGGVRCEAGIAQYVPSGNALGVDPHAMWCGGLG